MHSWFFEKINKKNPPTILTDSNRERNRNVKHQERRRKHYYQCYTHLSGFYVQLHNYKFINLDEMNKVFGNCNLP